MKKSPLIAEVIGPSGAGKSCLSVAINESGDEIRAGITVWKLPLPMLFFSAVLSLPTLIFLLAERRRFRADDFKQIVRLNAFYRKLKNEIDSKNLANHAALLFDEGVVFALAKLRADAFNARKKSALLSSRWESRQLDRWAQILGAVFWLDAPDELLIERIRTRAKWHRMKDKPDEELQEFLKRYRLSYEQIIDELKSRRAALEIVRFQTDRASSDAMADEIFKLVKNGGRKNFPASYRITLSEG